jgi:hypothetical protein
VPQLTPASEGSLTLDAVAEGATSLTPLAEGAESLTPFTEQRYSIVGNPGLYPSLATFPSAETFPSPGNATITPGPVLGIPAAGSLALQPLTEA